MPKKNRSRDGHPRLTLITLGSACIKQTDSRGDEQIVLGPGKPLAIIAYAATCPKRTVVRSDLIRLLWSDRDAAAAKHALRQTIWALKNRIHDSIFTTEGDAIILSDTIACDRDLFIAAADDTRFEEAINLYGGEFLQHFDTGHLDWEHWLEAQRYQLRLILRNVGEVAIRRQLSEGKTGQALNTIQRCHRVDPDHVGFRTLLVEALLSAGDFVAARVAAEALERNLDLQSRNPDSATRDIISRARRDPNGHAHVAEPDIYAELVGREYEFTTLINAWNAVARGSAKHICVTGPFGIGKTRLINDCHKRLLATGARSVMLKTNPAERNVPFALAGDIVGALAGFPGAKGISPGAVDTLIHLNPTLTSHFTAVAPSVAMPSPDEQLRRRTLALVELIREICEEAPLALFIDDFHHADAESQAVLAGLLGRSNDIRALVVSTSRPIPDMGAPTLTTTLLPLSPLNTRQIRTLLEGLAPLPDEPWTERLIEQLIEATAGCPGYLAESLRLILDGGAVSIVGNEWIQPPDNAGVEAWTPGRSVRERLNEMDRNQLHLLHALVASDTPIEVGDLMRLPGMTGSDVLHNLTVLERAGFVRHDGFVCYPVNRIVTRILRDTLGTEPGFQSRRALEQLANAVAPGPLLGSDDEAPTTTASPKALDDHSVTRRPHSHTTRSVRSAIPTWYWWVALVVALAVGFLTGALLSPF